MITKKKQSPPQCALLLLLACCAPPLEPARAAAPRIALVSQSSQALAGQALDLALVELTKKGEVDLVERDAINAVLREHQIALTEADAGLRVGQLLRADLIGVVDATQDGKELGGLVVLDSASGVVFANEGLAGLKAAEAASLVAKAVSASAKKRALPADQRNTVCLLGARNSEFARSKDVFCETVAYLVERRLLQAEGVTTLDRRRLDAVLKENSLPGQAERKALLPSLHLLELDFRRGTNDGEMKVVLRLSDAKGNTVASGEVSGREEAPKLVELAGAKVCELLRVAPPAQAGDPKAEAERFQRQATFLDGVRLKEESWQALTTAFALDPDRVRVRYVNTAAARAALESGAGRYEYAVSLCQLAFETADGDPIRRDTKQLAAWLTPAIANCIDHLPRESPLDAAVESLRLRCLTELGLDEKGNGVGWNDGRMISFNAVKTMYDMGHSPKLKFPVVLALKLCRTSDEFFARLDRRLDAWLIRERNLDEPHDREVLYSLHELCSANRYAMKYKETPLPFDRRYAEGVRAVCRRMMAHPRAAVQLEGRLGLLFVDSAQAYAVGESSGATIGFEVPLEIVHDAAAAAGASATPRSDRAVCYELAMQGLGWMQYNGRGSMEQRQEAILALTKGMLERRHLSPLVITHFWIFNLGQYASAETKAAADQRFDRFTVPMIDSILEASEDSSFDRLGVDREYLKRAVGPLREYRTKKISPQNDLKPAWTNALAHLNYRFMGVLARDGDKSICAFTGPRRVGSWGYRVDREQLLIHRIRLSDGYSGPPVAEFEVRGHPVPVSDHNAYCQDGVRWRLVNGACLDDHHTLYVATGMDGVLVVPADARAPFRIGVEDGLPSDVIQSVAVVSNDLFLACGNAGYRLDRGIGSTDVVNWLLRYNLVSKHASVIASTARPTSETPWDDLDTGFYVRNIFADAARGRLVMLLNAEDLQPSTGIWEYRLGERQLRQLVRSKREFHAAQMDYRGRLSTMVNCINEWRPVREPGCWAGLLHFDPATDNAQLICASKAAATAPAIPPTSNTFFTAQMSPYITALIDDWVYYLDHATALGAPSFELKRTSLITRRNELLDVSGPPGDGFGEWGYLDWLPGPGLLLVGTGRELRAFKPNHDRAAHGLLDATREQFVGRWAYTAQGKSWEREFRADGTAVLRCGGKDTPSFNGFKWTVEQGALLLRRGDGTLDERSYLADADTLTFTMSGWESARRVTAAAAP